MTCDVNENASELSSDDISRLHTGKISCQMDRSKSKSVSGNITHLYYFLMSCDINNSVLQGDTDDITYSHTDGMNGNRTKSGFGDKPHSYMCCYIDNCASKSN